LHTELAVMRQVQWKTITPYINAFSQRL